jgi:tRNA-Thr(GGU) m(6)t(6)A37 methyltransferase TsaA
MLSREFVVVGHAETPWRRGHCPKNVREARARGGGARILVAADFRPALRGVQHLSHVILLGWFESAARDLLSLQPDHLAEPAGVFALRSPARPNPISLSVAQLLAVDVDAGVLTLDALDWFDGTPVLDIKPYHASVDAVPAATVSLPRRS